MELSFLEIEDAAAVVVAARCAVGVDTGRASSSFISILEKMREGLQFVVYFTDY